jgi:hypothetical protein
VDDLVAAHIVHGLSVEVVELVHDGPHRERHVVAGVPVGNGEDVQVVDLAAPRLEVRRGGLDHPAKSLN